MLNAFVEYWYLFAAAFIFLPAMAIVVLGVFGKYSALLTHDHFLQIARGLKKARDEAIKSIDKPFDPKTLRPGQLPPGAFVTSAGLCVAYSIACSEGRQQHHLSMSHGGGWFAVSAARTIITYILRLMNQPVASARVGLSTGGRYHVAFERPLTSTEDVPVTIPGVEQIAGIYAVCFSEGKQLQIETIVLPEQVA